LREFYTDEEAEFGAKMPFSLSKVDKIARLTGRKIDQCKNILEKMADKGLVLDISHGQDVYYMISPIVIGIFEFTMMRAGNLPFEKYAHLFYEYLEATPEFIKSYNIGDVRLGRVMPYEESFKESVFSEVLDYEKLSHIIETQDTFSLGTCACRHTAHHRHDKKCDTPLDTCMAMGNGAKYLLNTAWPGRSPRRRSKAAWKKSAGITWCISLIMLKKMPFFYATAAAAAAPCCRASTAMVMPVLW